MDKAIYNNNSVLNIQEIYPEEGLKLVRRGRFKSVSSGSKV